MIGSMPGAGQQPLSSQKSTQQQNVKTNNAPINITRKVLKKQQPKKTTKKLPDRKTLMF